MIGTTLARKYQALQQQLKQLGSLAVAFSSGVDSTFLLYAARQALGENVLALTAQSVFFPENEGEEASSFCREIELTKEQVDELQKLVREADLGQINGIDIHTADVPYDAPEYEAEIELASGDIIRSSANWDNVPENWKQFQEPVHHLLFFAFVDAGYHYNGGDFHSTKPMKRVRASGRLYRAETGLKEDEVYIKPDWKKGYEYSLDTHYFKFSDPENRYPVLMKTLDALSDKYRKTAEEQLKKDYEMMEKVPKNVWKKADRKYCYSLFAVDQWEMNGRLFRFTVSVGFSNSLGAGDNGYGRYYYDHYLIDAETGEILSLSDLFVSPEAISSFLSEQMILSGISATSLACLKNLQYVLVGQLPISAGGEDDGVGDLLPGQTHRDPQFPEVGGHSDLLDKVRQSVDPGPGQLCLALFCGVNTPDPLGEFGELVRAFFTDKTVVGHMESG